jgi:cell division septation protein DedD
MRKFVVPMCVAVAALAAGCTSTSAGTGVRVGAASTSPTATGTVPSLPSGTSGSPTPVPTETHTLGPEPTDSPSPSETPSPSPSKKPKPKPSQSPKPSGAAAVVTSYISAINRRDYRTAWTIYRHAAKGQSYSEFVAGFASTDHDQLKILGTSGSTVRVDLVAYQTDGSKHHFTGTYTVSNGRIYASHISAAS